MALNRTIRGLLEKQWTTEMVENSHRQGRVHYLESYLQSNDRIRLVMDYAQHWAETPQGRHYWGSIANDL